MPINNYANHFNPKATIAYIQVMRLDLLDTNSVRSFAKAFKSKYNKLDRLINNAGVSEPGITKVYHTSTLENCTFCTECLNCFNRYNCSTCNNAAAV